MEIEFGNPVYDYDARYPMPKELRAMTQTNEEIKLTAIFYKCFDGCKAISAIGLEYIGGHVSPIFECEGAKREQLKRIEINPSERIDKVGALINKIGQISGISLKGKREGRTVVVGKDKNNP